MTLNDLWRKTSITVAKNSPAILTAAGVVGVLTTAYLTGKATFKAAELIDYDERHGGVSDDPKQRFLERSKLVWKLYIPAALSAVTTCTAIVLANRIGHRRTAALAAAYAVSDRAFTEYKEKVREKLGERKEQAVRDEIAQERIDKSPHNNQIVITDGEVLCYDSFSGRYFKSDMETLKKAMNDVNYLVNNEYYASLSDFYSRVGLPHTSISDEVGWNSDALLEIDFSTTLSDDGKPCISVDFQVVPKHNYYKLLGG